MASTGAATPAPSTEPDTPSVAEIVDRAQRLGFDPVRVATALGAAATPPADGP